MKRLLGFPPGYWSRFRLLALAAAAAFVFDHSSKLTAAVLDPSTYVLNPSSDIGDLWAYAALPVLACVLSFRPLALGAGLWAGGSWSNIADVYLWPQGVPDFIDTGWPDAIWNLADLFIAVGAIVFAVSLLVLWPARGIYRRRRKNRRAELPPLTRAAPDPSYGNARLF